MLIKGRFLADGGFIERNGITAFNLYREPTLRHGDAGTGRAHGSNTIRRLSDDDADHIIKWLAHRVQRPRRKSITLSSLADRKVSARTHYWSRRSALSGRGTSQKCHRQHVLGRFNGFLQSVILRVSEARDCGELDRYKFYDHSKSLIAAPPDVLRVDEKHLREYSVQMCAVLLSRQTTRPTASISPLTTGAISWPGRI